MRPVATDVDCCEETLCDFGGVLVVKEFVSAQEESIIVTDIDSQKWADSQSGRRKQVRVYRSRSNPASVRTPSFIMSIYHHINQHCFQEK